VIISLAKANDNFVRSLPYFWVAALQKEVEWLAAAGRCFCVTLVTDESCNLGAVANHIKNGARNCRLRFRVTAYTRHQNCIYTTAAISSCEPRAT
jgi:hypothetical protein